MLLQLFIINRSGGLIFYQDLSSAAPRLSSNDSLRLGSTFHSLHVIAAQVAPVISSGIQRLEATTFSLRCLQTLTGVKFVITAEPNTANLGFVLQSIYELYSDYVLKNPFYELEMPVRCEQFSYNLEKIIARVNAGVR